MSNNNEFTPPQIIDYDYYVQFYVLPKVDNVAEQQRLIERWIIQCQDQIDVLCGCRVYSEYAELDLTKPRDQKRLYYLQKAICSLLEYYIDTGKAFVDRNFSSASNVPANLNASTEDANFEHKRKDIIKLLVAGDWYQTLNTYSNAQDIGCGAWNIPQVSGWTDLVERLSQIFKRLDNLNNFTSNVIMNNFNISYIKNLEGYNRETSHLRNFTLDNCKIPALDEIVAGGYLKSIYKNEDIGWITIVDNLGNAVGFPYGTGGGGTGGIGDVLVNGVSVVSGGIANINLSNYATLTQLNGLIADSETSSTKTWSSNKINTLFQGLSGVVSVEVVTTLPETLVDKTMYYVLKAGTTNVYDIRLYLNNILYDMGTTQLDLSNYQEKITSSNKLLSDLVDDTAQTNKFVTEAEKTTWNGKSLVTVSDTGTSTDEIEYITIDGVEKKIAGGTTPTNIVTTDTDQTITGFKTFDTGSEGFKIQGSSYYTQLTPSGGIFDTGGSSVAFSWPSTTGQLAVTSQIPSTDYLVTTNTEQDIIGFKTFTNAQGIKVGGATDYVRMVASGFDRLYLGTNYFYSFPNRAGTLATNNDIATALTGYQPKIDSSHKLDYSLLENTPTIPTKTSDLTNDSNFVNQTDLQQGLATKETVGVCYTKTESDDKYVPKTALQTFYDGIFPVNFVYYGETAPGKPDGVSATWTEQTDKNLRYLQVSSETAGTTKAEQLPNIRGTFGRWLNNVVWSGYTSGAFAGPVQLSSLEQKPDASVGSNAYTYGMSFSAAGSNSTYVDGGKVQPLTVTLKRWKRTA